MRVLLALFENKWFRRGLITTLLIACLIIGGRWYLGYYIDSHLIDEMGLAEYEELQRFLDSPLAIPDEWYDVKPFPDDLIELDRKFQAEWEPLTSLFWQDYTQAKIRSRLFESISEGDPLSDEEKERIQLFLDKYTPYTQSLINFVNHPQYEIGALGCSSPFFMLPSYTCLNCAIFYYQFNASLQSQNGNWEEAFQSLLICMKAGVRHPAYTRLEGRFAFQYMARGCEPIPWIVSSCSDEAILIQTLEEMNQLAPSVDPEPRVDLNTGVIVGTLREVSRKNVPVSFYPGMTGREATRQVYDIERYYPKSPGLSPEEILNQVNANKSFSNRIQYSVGDVRHHLRAKKTSPFGWDATDEAWYRWKDLRSFSEILRLPDDTEAVFLHAGEHNKMTQSEDDRLLAIFDLARLALAARIVELETGEKPTDPSVFSPRFFPEPLTDPEFGTPYIWDATEQRFVRPEAG